MNNSNICFIKTHLGAVIEPDVVLEEEILHVHHVEGIVLQPLVILVILTIHHRQ